MIHRLLVDMIVPDTRALNKKAHILSFGFSSVRSPGC